MANAIRKRTRTTTAVRRRSRAAAPSPAQSGKDQTWQLVVKYAPPRHGLYLDTYATGPDPVEAFHRLSREWPTPAAQGWWLEKSKPVCGSGPQPEWTEYKPGEITYDEKDQTN